MAIPSRLTRRLRIRKNSRTVGVHMTHPPIRHLGPGAMTPGPFFGSRAIAPPKSSKTCACSNPNLAPYLVRYDTVKGNIRYSQEEYRCADHLSEPVQFGSEWKIENQETYHNVPPFSVREDPNKEN